MPRQPLPPTVRNADVVAQLRRDLDQRLAEGHRFVRIGDVLRMLDTVERAERTEAAR